MLCGNLGLLVATVRYAPSDIQAHACLRLTPEAEAASVPVSHTYALVMSLREYDTDVSIMMNGHNEAPELEDSILLDDPSEVPTSLNDEDQGDIDGVVPPIEAYMQYVSLREMQAAESDGEVRDIVLTATQRQLKIARHQRLYRDLQEMADGMLAIVPEPSPSGFAIARDGAYRIVTTIMKEKYLPMIYWRERPFIEHIKLAHAENEQPSQALMDILTRIWN